MRFPHVPWRPPARRAWRGWPGDRGGERTPLRGSANGARDDASHLVGDLGVLAGAQLDDGPVNPDGLEETRALSGRSVGAGDGGEEEREEHGRFQAPRGSPDRDALFLIHVKIEIKPLYLEPPFPDPRSRRHRCCVGYTRRRIGVEDRTFREAGLERDFGRADSPAFDLEPLEVNLFRGQSRHMGGPRVFGGQVIGQALVAAERTGSRDGFPTRCTPTSSLAGDVGALASSTRWSAFATEGASPPGACRRSSTIAAILSMIASFQAPRGGAGARLADARRPAARGAHPVDRAPRTVDLQGHRLRYRPACSEALRSPSAIESRSVEPLNPLRRTGPGAPSQAVWFRAVDRVPDDPRLHRCILAYASDFHLVGTALRPHGRSW